MRLHRAAAGAALAFALLCAPALADHVFSHRIVVEGRLLGNDGTPLPGREIEIFSENDDFLEGCTGDGQDRITDDFGDFRFCFHHHELAPGARIGVTSGNATTMKPVDVAFRRMVMLMRDTNETGTPPPSWNETYRISGRAWRVGPTTLEGVPVFGVAATGVDVNLTVKGPDNATSTFHSRTDAFGDFELVIETEANVSDLGLTLEALGRAQPTQLDPFFHRTYAPLYLPGTTDPSGVATQDPPFGSGFSQAPGSSTPRMDPVLIVAAAIALVLAIALSRRKKA